MHPKSAERIAGFIFTVIVPFVMASMIPHIPPSIGWPIVVASVLLGLAAFLHAGRRIRMFPMILMGVGATCFCVGAVWNYVSDFQTKKAAFVPAMAPIVNPTPVAVRESKDIKIAEPTALKEKQRRSPSAKVALKESDLEPPQLDPAPILNLAQSREKIRALFDRVDSRIVERIDGGFLTNTIRITESQYTKLLELKQTPAGEKLVLDATITGSLIDSLIDNGSLGPTTAEHLQYRINLTVSEDMRQ